MIGFLSGRAALAGLHLLDAETAHNVTVRALKSGLVQPALPALDPRLAVRIGDLSFPNPVGMAAGFDKNGEVPDAVLRLGFGFTEAGTVTPRPQPGNAKPRVFRLKDDRAVINRFGFNNEGHQAFRRRMEARKAQGGIVGINIGANKEASDRVADYVAGVHAFADLASYFTVNVSSPNTPGLRDLQAKDALAELLGGVMAARDEETERTGRKVPVLLKIAPDMDQGGLEDVAEEVLKTCVDGLIVSNTTLSRAGLVDANAQEAGGMSGRPLFRRSTIVLARMRRLVGPELPIIGVGGIDSPEAAWTKITAGANLVQLYSALVYEGPDLVVRIVEGLSKNLDKHGLETIESAVGVNIDAWADAEIG